MFVQPTSPTAAVFSFTGCLYRSARIRLAAKCIQPSRRWQASHALNDREKPWYGTTPIFYVNAAPHVGHLYSLVLTDIFKRWNTLRGRKALMCTGTDEHGMKVQRAADIARTEPKTFCDSGAAIFKSLAEKANISNDHFIRTTDESHRDAVQYAWTVLRDKELIYLSKHEGWYSVSDETFYPASGVHLVIDAPTGRKMMASIETGKEVEWTSETNYRFRLSAFREQLLHFYKQNPDFIKPESRMKEVVAAVEAGLDDLSVSRPSSRLTWGIPVPNDQSQTIYVWLDALINYATKAGYPWVPGREVADGWPADVHVIGKDIVRFHCIYWPAFLLGLDAALPKQVLSHAHWTLGKEKMAKSTGNVVNPFFAIDRFGVDVMRYYLAHDGGIQHDSDYGNEFIAERYKKGLQGGLGNLTSRVLRGKGWNVRRAIEQGTAGEFASTSDDFVNGQHALLEQAKQKVIGRFEDLDCGAALKEIMNVIYATNAFMAHVQPWQLVETAMGDPQVQKKLDSYIYICAEAIRISGVLLQPFMPTKAAQLLDMLGVGESNRTIDFASVGLDSSYGVAKAPVGKGLKHALFPPLLVED